MQNHDAEHRTCTASQYTQLHEKHNAQYKNKYINSHSAKQNWKNKKNCYRYHSSSQRSLSPFWFQLLTIFSSFIGRDFYHRQLLVFRIVKIKITIVTLITSYTNLATLKLDTHSSVQTLIDFTRTLLTFRFVIASMRSMVFKCLDNFLCFSLSSRTSHYENTQCYFSVGLPRTVCAFVSLTLDNILQQYVPRNTVAKFYPKCFLLLLWKISDQMISLDYYHPWSATNSARSFTFQPVSFGQWNVVS